MANKPKYTTQQVIDALQATRGMVYLAAKRLGCNPQTVMNYCQRHPTVEAAKLDARGELLDIAEIRLWAAVQRDEPWAVAFALKMLGKHRGYVDRLDVVVEIHRVATQVAVELGLTVEAVLTEAQQLLKDVEDGRA